VNIDIKNLNKNDEYRLEESLAPEIFANSFEEHDELKRSIREPITVQIRVYFVEQNLYVDCSMKTHLSPQCTNCLDEFLYSIDETFERIFFKDETNNPQSYVYNDEEEVQKFNLNKNKLEIIPLLAEHLCLIVPMTYRCSETCKGLCQYCGINKNRETCGCENIHNENIVNHIHIKELSNTFMRKGFRYASTKEKKK